MNSNGLSCLAFVVTLAICGVVVLLALVAVGIVTNAPW